MIKISPSILACDFSRLGEEVCRVKEAGIDMLHIDVMDGHFVPNISFGAGVYGAVRDCFSGCFDVHLMISHPYDYIDDFAKAGADLITIHAECQSDLHQTLRKIKEKGLKAGLSVKPKTPASAIAPYLDEVDLILVMTVEPGFGGQKFMADMVGKIDEIRQMIDTSGKPIDLEVDGGINSETARICVAHGANVLVAGSFLFSKPDMREAAKELVALCPESKY